MEGKADGAAMPFDLFTTADLAKVSKIPRGPVVDEFIEPVSYTHLRAHETVLDLVCRLLLEKKKNKKSEHTLCS